MLIDLALAASIIYGFYIGYKNEPLNKIFRLLPFLVGFLTAIYLAPLIYDKLAEMWGSDGIGLFVVAFIICALIGWSFSRYLADLFTKAAKQVKLNKPEKILNGLTVSFLFAILFSGLLAFFSKADIISEKTKDNSLSYGLIDSFPAKLKASFDRLRPGFKKFYEKSNEVIDNSDEKPK